MKINTKNYFKFFLALVVCLSVRLLPFRAPNVEPILATLMPIGRAYGALAGLAFAVLSILLYDVVTGTIGVQTFFTVIAYGTLGLWAAHYFKNKKANKWSYVRFDIVGTFIYDALTGFTVGPLFFHQTFWGSLVGQIPFTMLHLLGNTVFAFILSPAIYDSLIKQRPRDLAQESSPLINPLQPKTI